LNSSGSLAIEFQNIDMMGQPIEQAAVERDSLPAANLAGNFSKGRILCKL
jgi:hypothetical protein